MVRGRRTNELVKKAEDTLLPRLSELPGFNGYYLIEAGNGVISSVGFFDTAAHAEQSTGVAADWVREQKLETALPNPPKITNGQVVVHKIRELVEPDGLEARTSSPRRPAIAGLLACTPGMPRCLGVGVPCGRDGANHEPRATAAS